MVDLLAVDVGTLSARAGLFDRAGYLVASATAPFELLRPQDNQAVYRMDEIWAAVSVAVREAIAATPGRGKPLAGIAFDATSSLVVEAEGEAPLDDAADVFCWMDHRGEEEAAAINRTGDRYLTYVGGTVSPEMHLPKLLWLKRHRAAAWARVVAVRDLCDELARRATGVDGHSLCGLACKLPYLPGDSDPWRRQLLRQLDIEDLLFRGRLSERPGRVGARHGLLSPPAAQALGLAAGIPVAVGLIDAEAGALGVLGRGYRDAMNRSLALIGGTSTSYMAWAAEERHVPGIWGPFRDAVFPNYWLHEAGQSLSGAALDAAIAHHPGRPGSSAAVHLDTAQAIIALLAEEGPAFAARRHIVPDWLGNRAPLGDGSVRALLTGLGEDTSRRAFLEHYYAVARGLVLQSRQIKDHLNNYGYRIDRIFLAGGHLKNPLMRQLYRNALGCQSVQVDAPEPVLLGTAMVASLAAGFHTNLFEAMDAMGPSQTPAAPDPRWAAAHEAAYKIYLRLFETRNAVDAEARAWLHSLTTQNKEAAIRCLS
jgi:D-ribulokinase